MFTRTPKYSQSLFNILPFFLLFIALGTSTSQLHTSSSNDDRIGANTKSPKDTTISTTKVHQHRSNYNIMMKALGPRSKVEPRAQRVREPMINMYDGYGGIKTFPTQSRFKTFQSIQVPSREAIQKALKGAPKSINFLQLDHLAGLLSRLGSVIRSFSLGREQIVDVILSRVKPGPLHDLISSYSAMKSGDFYSGLQGLGRTEIPFRKIHRALSASSILSEIEMATTIKAFVSAFLGLDLEPTLKPLFDVELSKFLTFSVVSPSTSNRLKSRQFIIGDWPSFVQEIETKKPSKPARMTNVNRISAILKRAQDLPNTTDESMVAIKREMALFNASTFPSGPEKGLTTHIRFILEWSFDYNLSSIQILDVLLSSLTPHLNPGVKRVTSDMIHLHVPLTIVVKYLLSLDILETKMRAFQELYDSYQPIDKGHRHLKVGEILDQVQERILMLMNEVLVRNLDPHIRTRLLNKLFWNKVVELYPELRGSLSFSIDSSMDSIQTKVLAFFSQVRTTPLSRNNGTLSIDKVHRSGPLRTTVPALNLGMIFDPNQDIPFLTDGQESAEEEYYYHSAKEDAMDSSYDSSEKHSLTALHKGIPLKSRSETLPSTVEPLELTKETLKIKTTGAEKEDESTLGMVTPNQTTFAYYEELYNDFVDESYDLLRDHLPTTLGRSALERVKNATSIFRQMTHPTGNNEDDQHLVHPNITTTTTTNNDDDYHISTSTTSKNTPSKSQKPRKICRQHRAPCNKKRCANTWIWAHTVNAFECHIWRATDAKSILNHVCQGIVFQLQTPRSFPKYFLLKCENS
ncbi:uncharacterized protein LOC131881030 isoform X2 [Tigriopus californicus]|uniref:uncharacterized protein LOC131881030 isoform X2 n=1 Tax=Tigriopus californicus TaxID=6832 RepID=UPI0027DA743A|nr:uncharacterized protein LOC131881030 isoform X2 [Tigriopus californicus]